MTIVQPPLPTSNPLPFTSQHLIMSNDLGVQPTAATTEDGFPSTVLSPTSITRERYQQWFHSVDKQPYHGRFITVATWMFLHNNISHTIVVADDTYTMSRSLTCDDKETWKGNPDLGYWQLEFTMGRVEDPIHCIIEMVPTLTEGYKFNLCINLISFESARDSWIKEQALLDQQHLHMRRRSIEALAHERGEPVPIQRQLSHRQYIETHWGRWCDYEKTKLGGKKTKVTWKFTVKTNVHQLVLHHSWMSGKRKIFLDTMGEPIFWQKPSLLDRNKPFHHVIPIDGVDIAIVITKQLQRSAREYQCPYAYDLLIDHVPFDACMTVPSPKNAIVDVAPPKHRMKRATTQDTTKTTTSKTPSIKRASTTDASIATTAPNSVVSSTTTSTRTSPDVTPQQITRNVTSIDTVDDWSATFPTFDKKPPVTHMSGRGGNLIPVADVLGVASMDDGNPFTSPMDDTGNPFLSPSPRADTTTSSQPTTTAWIANFD